VSNTFLTGFTGYTRFFSQFPDETEKDIIPCEQILRCVEYTLKVCGTSPEISTPKADQILLPFVQKGRR
jgi:hypothetical protein